MTRLMVRAPIHMLTALTTMEIGSMINNTGSAWSPGQTEPNMREPTLTARRRVKENLLLPMAVIMKGNLSRMRYAVTENISGQMGNNMKANGAKIKCMVRVHLYGKIRKSTKVSS